MIESTTANTTPPFPQLNEPAPEFDAKTTHGRKTLREYQGRWLILFSHPADFTPVCTTEFIGFSKAWPEFQKLGCELLGLSIDSTYSHLAWVRNIIVPPPATVEEANARMEAGFDCVDWCFCEKDLPANQTAAEKLQQA